MNMVNLKQYNDLFQSTLDMLIKQTTKQYKNQNYQDMIYHNPRVKDLHEMNMDTPDNKSTNALPRFSLEHWLNHFQDQFWGIPDLLPSQGMASLQTVVRISVVWAEDRANQPISGKSQKRYHHGRTGWNPAVYLYGTILPESDLLPGLH